MHKKPKASRAQLWRDLSNFTSSCEDPGGVISALSMGWVQRQCAQIALQKCSLRPLISRLVKAPSKLAMTGSSQASTILISGALDKDHYLRPAISIISELRMQQERCRVLYGVPPDLPDNILLPDGVEQFNLHRECGRPTVSSLLYFVKIWKIWKRNRPVLLSKKWIPHERREILWASLQVEAYRSMLNRIGSKALVVMNEQHLPWSLVVSAAKSLSIPVHHILHGGGASPLYVPFQADFLWTDFKTTREALIRFGGDGKKIKLAPGISQTASDHPISNTPFPAQLQGSKRRCLFLSQWSGWAQYNFSIFRDGLIAVAKVMAERTENWEVWLRAHPYDNSKMQQDAILEFTSRGVPVVCVDNNQPLGEQASHCDIVGTVFSTGVFEAIHCGVPAFVFWNEDLKKSHGVPSLPDEWLVRKEVDLERIVDNLSDGDLSIEGVRESLHVDEWDAAPHKVVKGILESIS